LFRIIDTAPFRALSRVLSRWTRLKNPRVMWAQGQVFYVQSIDRLMAVLLHRFSLFERHELDMVRAMVKPGMVCLDIGANMGIYTFLLAELVGEDGRVHAYEPAPENALLLGMAVKANHAGNVVVEQKAVADTDGTIALHLCEEHTGDHSIFARNDSRKTVDVQKVAIDEEIKRNTPRHKVWAKSRATASAQRQQASAHASGRVDFIKMDIQGAEGLALQGMRETCKRNNDLVLLMEFSPKLLRACGTDPASVLMRLEQQGMRLYEIQGASLVRASPSHLLSRPEGAKDANIIACRRLPKELGHLVK